MFALSHLGRRTVFRTLCRSSVRFASSISPKIPSNAPAKPLPVAKTSITTPTVPQQVKAEHTQPSESQEKPAPTSVRKKRRPTSRWFYKIDLKRNRKPLSYHTVVARGRKGRLYYKKVYPRKHLQRGKKLLRRQNLRNRTGAVWHRVFKPGVLPAYDEALKFIQADSIKILGEWRALRRNVRDLQKELDVLKSQGQPTFEVENRLEGMREKLDILEVQSHVNLPQVRWTARQKYGIDMGNLVHRHLVEQSWRKGGSLDLTMERVYQMNVVPDLVAGIHPSVDLRLTTGLRPKSIHPRARNPYLIEPGSFLTPKQTLRPPTLYTTVFHTDTRLYTLVMIDPDVPDVANNGFTSYLHWLQPNIPLSCSNTTRLADINSHTPYTPPHPQKGSPYHRYVILLLPNPPLSQYSRNVSASAIPGTPTSKFLEIPKVRDEERLGFNLREFVHTWDLDPANGGGVNMWREVWDETVTNIYQRILKQAEPRYGLPPKENPYLSIRNTRKYVNTYKQSPTDAFKRKLDIKH